MLQIHWFSIFNSFMMVIFLTGLVAIILMRTLRKDYARYAKTEDDMESLERDLSEVCEGRGGAMQGQAGRGVARNQTEDDMESLERDLSEVRAGRWGGPE